MAGDLFLAMSRIIERFRRLPALAHDLLVIPIAWLGAYWLRFNLGEIPAQYWQAAMMTLPVVIVAQGLMFWQFGLYRGVWRYASLPDILRILKAVASGVMISALLIFFWTRLQSVPRSVFILDAILLFLLLGGSRFLYRLLSDRRIYAENARNVLVVGAGSAGEMLVRDLLRDPAHAYRPVAYVDDDPAKHGKEIHGVRVLGACDAIAEAIQHHDVNLILIALPTASTRQMRRVVELCESTGLPFRSLPRLQDLVSGQVSLRDLREVKIDDLLGREPVTLDWPAIRRGIEGKTVLVTGGGGSIGSELCRQLAQLKPLLLIVFEQSEYNLYLIELELRREYPDLPLHVVLGDIGDAVALEALMRSYRPQVIFHAAAYKHVPMLEDQVRTAVRNNVLGTRVLATLADRHQCETFVMVSTDKAVNPANIMGMTKRVAEIFCQNLGAQSATHFITVRFGNVLGSTGSVIPLFQQQIAMGGPVTVTHPEITRYFMTIPEATQLILQAGGMGKGGEIYVLDMGEPVKIAYLAEQLIRLTGKKPGEDIDIVYTGLRPGEKLYEELFHESERLAGTSHPKILLSNSRRVEFTELQTLMEQFELQCATNNVTRLQQLLCELVPEHQLTVTADEASTSPAGAQVITLLKPVKH
jgi:FlaA1/EpsC-like NDP-sugar epimerase